MPFAFLRVPAKSLNGLLTGGHTVCSKQLVEVAEEAFCRAAEVDGILGLQLADDLLGEDVIQCHQLVSAAGDEDGDIGVDLLHDAVTEGDVEVLDEVLVQHLKSGAVAAADGVLLGGGIGQLGEVIGGDVAGGGFGGDEALALAVEVENHGAVIDLIRYSEGGVIVVSGADDFAPSIKTS